MVGWERNGLHPFQYGDGTLPGPNGARIRILEKRHSTFTPGNILLKCSGWELAVPLAIWDARKIFLLLGEHHSKRPHFECIYS